MPGGLRRSGGSARPRRPKKERRWTRARGSEEVQGTMGSRRERRLLSKLGQRGDKRGVAVEPRGRGASRFGAGQRDQVDRGARVGPGVMRDLDRARSRLGLAPGTIQRMRSGLGGIWDWSASCAGWPGRHGVTHEHAGRPRLPR